MEREIIKILNRDSAKQCKKCKKKATVVCSGCTGNVFCGSDCAIGHQLICGGEGKRKANEVEEFQSLPGPNADENAARFVQLFQTLRDNSVFMRNMIEGITTEQINVWRLTSRVFNQYLGQNVMFWFMLVQIKYPRPFNSKSWSQNDIRWIEFGKKLMLEEQGTGPKLGFVPNLELSYYIYTLEKEYVGQPLYELYLNEYEKRFRSLTKFSEWVEITGTITVDGSTHSHALDTEGYPFDKDDFENIPDDAADILVVIEEEYKPPNIEIVFRNQNGNRQVEKLSAEEMLDAIYNPETRPIYLLNFVIPDNFPQNGRVRIEDKWSGQEEIRECAVQEIYSTLIDMMSDLSPEFYDKAGPWVGDRVTWKIKITLLE